MSRELQKKKNWKKKKKKHPLRLRELSRHPKIHSLLGNLVISYFKLVRWTCRWQVLGTAERDRLYAAGQPFIIALWHNRIGMMPFAFAEENEHLTIVTSSHRDGNIVIKALRHFGFQNIVLDRRAPLQATKTIVRCLHNGGYVGITPDGPRGPNQQVKIGIIRIALMAGVPIVPVTYAVKHGKRLRSWDRFMVPRPFNKGVCLWGKPIDVPHSDDSGQWEQSRLKLEHALLALGEEANELLEFK